MSSFTCHCGYCFHDNTDNLRFKAYILPDQDMNEFDSLFEQLADTPPVQGGKLSVKQHEIYVKMRDLLNRCIFQCPECGRLFLKNEKGRLTMFTPSDTAEPEQDVDRNMLMSAHGASWHGTLYGEWYDPMPVWMKHPGLVGTQIKPPEPAQYFDDFAETERQFRILFEKLRARDCIDYAEFRIHEENGSRCLFSWRRENADI